MPSRVYQLMFQPGEVVEIRAIGGLKGKNPAWEGSCYGAKGTVSGYFDNAEAFGKAALALDKAGAHGVYFTLNPCVPALLARAVNRLKANVNTTTDADIACIRWLPIDLDPRRPAGISSTQGELDAAVETAKKIAEFLEGEKGWSKGIRAVSGNGFHLMYRLKDLPNEPATPNLIRNILAFLAERFGTSQVAIDQAVFNPSRIWKVYGTHARKGDSTPNRPHRLSKLLVEKSFTSLTDIPPTE